MFDKTRVKEINNISWPALMDMSSADCHRLLRQNEIEAYSKVVSAFRAQGLFTSEKKSVLSDLQRLLNISGDRHRAEVRRAVNDDELATISECVCGKRTDDSWFSEGRRITPIIQRGVPQTAFLLDADAVASKIASFKFKMPNKSKKLAISVECSQTNESADSVPCAEAVANVNKVKNDENVPNDDVTVAELFKVVPSNDDTNETPVVPEAAVEVTCEADATPRPKLVSTAIEEKASLIAELPVEKVPKDKALSSTLSSQLDENTQHSPPLIKQIPVIQSVISGIKRPHSVLESSVSMNSSQAQLSLPTTSLKGTKNGGTVPFISTTRNFLIRPNTPQIPSSSTLKPLSQGNQMNRVQGSSNPVIPIPIITRSSPLSTLTSTPSLTTFVMTGSSGPTAFISQSSNNASRVFKNYSTVISSNQQQQNVPISASAPENRKMHPAHSIIVQSSQPSTPKPLQTTNSSTRNVYFVPQGPANRLVTSSSTVGSTNQPSTSRPLRILPVNNSLITTSTSATNMHAKSSTLGPLLTSTNLPSKYQNQQNNSRVCGDSELSSPAVNLVKVAAAPVNIGYSPSVGSLLANSASVNISTTSQQVNSPSQLVSMLDPKRPRLAFMSTASPSTRQ